MDKNLHFVKVTFTHFQFSFANKIKGRRFPPSPHLIISLYTQSSGFKALVFFPGLSCSGCQSPSALNGCQECINAFSLKEKKEIYSVISYLLYFFALKKSYVCLFYMTL